MATIDIRIQRVDQLLDSLDPSPFSENEKALRRDAENYIVDFAGEYGRAEPLRLIVHAPASIESHAGQVTGAIHAHFQFAYEQCRRQYRRRMRIGRKLLVVGVAVLVSALLLRTMLGTSGDSPIFAAIGEGLLILGWVAMWCPVDILLFERVENHQDSTLFQRLAQIPVTFEFGVTEPARSEVGGGLPASRE
ncbi:MAG: hypothetical protein Q8K12_17540 [Thiobacillus sp.]|nr:hypothetical protein [Thiobacillus sp.]